MVANLKEHYNRGALANRLALKRDSDPRTFTRSFAAKKGIGYTTMMKERLFARRYNRAEFDELCDLRRNSADPDVKLPFHWGFLPYLLTVENKQERSKLQREATEHGWTAPELYQIIKDRFPESRRQAKGHRGGRNRKEFPTSKAGLAAIALDADRLRRRCEDVLKKFKPEVSKSTRTHLQRLLGELERGIKHLSRSGIKKQ